MGRTSICLTISTFFVFPGTLTLSVAFLGLRNEDESKTGFLLFTSPLTDGGDDFLVTTVEGFFTGSEAFGAE